MSVTFSSSTLTLTWSAELPRSGYVPEIDAVRALAILFVILGHAGFMPFGWVGVWAFFVVSGFAVTTSLLRSKAGPRLQQIKHFYFRRCLRIWPLYFLFIVINAIYLLYIRQESPLKDIPYLLSFTYDFRYGFGETGRGPTDWSPYGTMWSLSVEEQFYLFFPWLFFYLDRRRLTICLLSLIASGFLLRWGVGEGLTALGWSAFQSNRAIYAFGPCHFDAFAAGALIALFRKRIERSPILTRSFAVVTLVATSLYIGTIVSLQAYRAGLEHAFHNVIAGVLIGDLKEVFVYPVMWSLSAAFIMLIIAREHRTLSLCRNELLQSIGRISFGLYLLHIPVFMLTRSILRDGWLGPVPQQLDKLLILLIAVPASYGLAWLSFYCFEEPILRQRSKFQ